MRTEKAGEVSVSSVAGWWAKVNWRQTTAPRSSTLVFTPLPGPGRRGGRERGGRGERERDGWMDR